jgi:hypothetical protein
VGVAGFAKQVGGPGKILDNAFSARRQELPKLPAAIQLLGIASLRKQRGCLRDISWDARARTVARAETGTAIGGLSRARLAEQTESKSGIIGDGNAVLVHDAKFGTTPGDAAAAGLLEEMCRARFVPKNIFTLQEAGGELGTCRRIAGSAGLVQPPGLLRARRTGGKCETGQQEQAGAQNRLSQRCQE